MSVMNIDPGGRFAARIEEATLRFYDELLDLASELESVHGRR